MDAKLPRDFDAQVFGYFDEPARAHAGGRKGKGAPGDGGGSPPGAPPAPAGP